MDKKKKDITTTPRYYLIKGSKGSRRKRLVMTRGLTTKEAREEAREHFLDTINDPSQMKRVKAVGIPEEFSSGVDLVKSQSFTIGLIEKRRKKKEIVVAWVTTFEEKMQTVFTAE